MSPFFSTIRTKYSLAFGGLAVIFMAVIIATYQLVGHLQNSVGHFSSGISLVQNADRDLYQSRLALSILVTEKPSAPLSSAERAIFAADVSDNADQAYDRMQEFRELTAGIPEIVTALQSFENKFKGWNDGNQSISALLATGRQAEAYQLFITENQQYFLDLRELYNYGAELIERYALLEKESITKKSEDFKTVLTVLASAVLLACIALAWFAPRNISRAIRTVTQSVVDIGSGDGDLTRRLENLRQDETGELGRAFNGFIDNLAQMIREIHGSNQQVSRQMADLSKAAGESKSISVQQSQSLEMIVSAISQMSIAIHEVAENASGTLSQITEVNQLTHDGQTTLRQSIHEIENLSSQVSSAADVIARLTSNSENIASVLDVILGIAEQTNLLALNAAIEAARAGEQGRGFAVVADEVRGLASKTQQSTADIRNMITQLQLGVKAAVQGISESVESAALTVQLSHKASGALEAIKHATSKVQDLAGQTAAATEEQSQAANEINENIANLAGLTQQVLEISGRVNHSVAETQAYSGELTSLVNRFRV